MPEAIQLGIQLSSDTSYDKIKHLVEVEDDIFAVFTINSTGEVYNLTVAKNIDFEKSLVENIYTNFNKILEQDNKITDIFGNINSSSAGGSATANTLQLSCSSSAGIGSAITKYCQQQRFLDQCY